MCSCDSSGRFCGASIYEDSSLGWDAAHSGSRQALRRCRATCRTRQRPVIREGSLASKSLLALQFRLRVLSYSAAFTNASPVEAHSFLNSAHSSLNSRHAASLIGQKQLHGNGRFGVAC